MVYITSKLLFSAFLFLLRTMQIFLLSGDVKRCPAREGLGPSIFPNKSRLIYLGRSKKDPARMVIKRNPSDSLLHQMKGGIPYLNLQKGFSLEFTFIQHFKYVNIKRNESNHFLRGSVNKRVVPFPRTIIIKRRKIFFGDQPPPPLCLRAPPYLKVWFRHWYFSIDFAIVSIAVTVSSHLHVVCRHFICQMSLFQGHVPC